MCGLAGFYDKSSRNTYDLAQTTLEMIEKLVHRGPDDQGYWVSHRHPLALGFRRLSIIQLSDIGHQPHVSQDENFAMVFNGEIYNYKELHEALSKAGCDCDGSSDSVVLFNALCFWGVEYTLRLVNGMFSIVFWSEHDGHLYLVRDRLGQKPLYYSYDNQTLLFASEIKSLLVHPSFKRKMNVESVGAFLKYAYVPDPFSIYENTYKVKPGEYVLFSTKKNTILSKKYWVLEDCVTQTESESITEDDIHEALSRSVKLRMRSDVPFGAFLSGGIDSSLITALMQKQSSQSIQTFSIGFEESQFDESKYAKRIAQHLGTQHTDLYVKSSDALNVIPKLHDIYDEPFADSSQIPTYLLSSLTKKHVTVALSGDGGDEVFAGYNRHFWVPQIYKNFTQRSDFFKKYIAFLISRLSPQTWNKLSYHFSKFVPEKYRYRCAGDKLYKVLPFLELENPLEIYDKLISYWYNPSEILNYGVFLKSHIISSLNLLELVKEMLYLDTKYYLPGDILTKIDRASMASSLEVRSPFLDHNVVEKAWQLPLNSKLYGKKGKLVLRNILARYVPPHLFERPKMGFGIPLDDWLRGPLKEWAYDLIDYNRTSCEIFNQKVLDKYWREHLNKERNWQYPLWSVLILLDWIRHYL